MKLGPGPGVPPGAGLIHTPFGVLLAAASNSLALASSTREDDTSLSGGSCGSGLFVNAAVCRWRPGGPREGSLW